MTGMLSRAGVLAAALVFAAVAHAQPLGPPDVPVLLGEFKGTLPCADCQGIETSLTLIQKDEGTAEGSYVLIETYLGKSADPMVAEGSWTTLRGSAADPDDTVIELNPDSLEFQRRAFLKASDYALRLLGPGLAEIAGAGNVTLVSAADPFAGMPNPAAINCVKIGGTSVIHTGTTAGDQGVCRLPDGRECEEFAVLRDHRCLDPAKPRPPPRRPSKEDDTAPNY
ncbi:MAG: copper resistance protein NlpE N-terminal domain-containing protein [Sphingomonadales bacterium]